MGEWKKNTVHTLEITGYTAEGMGVARLDGRVVFVPATIQGEQWKVQLLKVNKKVGWGRGVELLVPSPERLEPDCPLYGRCGGCQFRHMTYSEELWAKGQRVQDALSRLGGVELTLAPVLGAEDTQRYRNKVQFPVVMEKNGLAVGYYRPRSHDVLDAPDCLLQPVAVTALRQAFRQWMADHSVPPYEESTHTGLIRHLYVRTNHKGEALVCVVVNGDSLPFAQELVASLGQAHPALMGVVLNENRKQTNVILGEKYHTLWGQDWLEEELCGLRFQLSVPSFFQINRDQTQRLYGVALEFAQLTGRETVLDLYCGIGTITLALAGQAHHVIGAEIVPQAIEDARENARRNGLSNTEFFCGDAGAVAEKLAGAGTRPDVICVDPPRKGLAPEVPGILAGMEPERIVYVSCDPATLARDVKLFGELGYQVEKAQGVDMFSRCAHIETVVLLSRETNPLTVEVRMEVETGEVKEHPTYKRIQEYVQEKYGFKVHTAYIAEVKRMVGLDMHKAPNAVEQRKHEYHPCPPEKVEAIKDALRHFGLTSE